MSVLTNCRSQLAGAGAALALVLATASSAVEEIVAYDLVGGASQNLVSFNNPFDGAFSSPGDGFQVYQRGVSPTIPFPVLDDSLSIFPPDSLGIITEGNTDPFFGVVDTINTQNSGPATAEWQFDISGGTGLYLSIDMGAMGDFESSDEFAWTYSIDGGPELTAFASSVDEAGAQTYTLEGGGMFTLNDPMLVGSQTLSNELATLSAPLIGTGSVLTLKLTATMNGGTEALAFQNILITRGGFPTAATAYDLVASSALNLTGYANPFTGAFASGGDGFEVYQRGVSSSIPFSVLDDSLSIFPPDSLGIIKEGNVDAFFGVVDTINSQNSGPASATWTFDVSGATSGLVLSIAMGAMGDFESSDNFEWAYALDGGPSNVAFAGTADESGSLVYTLEGGAVFTLNDPMTIGGVALDDDLRTFNAPLIGVGNTLTLTLTATANGGSEAFAFQNIILSDADVPPAPPSNFEIFQIQGSGTASPLVGQSVITEANVVTAVGTNGFFMQTPTARSDGDEDTSDGIFVFTGGIPFVAVGDSVDVSGIVEEFFGFTEIGAATVTVVGVGFVPAAVQLDAVVPSPSPLVANCAIEFECLEGMLVEIADGTVTGPNQRFGSDPIAEVHITAAAMRTFREPGIAFPGLPGLPVWDGNPEVFELDPDKLGLSNLIIPAGSLVTATGVLGFEFGGYELWPSAVTVVEAPLPVAVRGADPGEVTIGTLNLFRLFDDVDDPADGDRNDAVSSTAEYARRLAKFSSYIRDVLGAPDVLAVQEVESLKVLQDLAVEIALDDPSVAYTASLVEGNDIGTIDVGFLTRDRVVIDAVTQLGAAETFVNPLTLEDNVLHDRPPLLLDGWVGHEFGAVPITAMVVHNRSLGGIDGSQGERVREKRFRQALSIAEKVQALQASQPDVRLVVLGDFNAFEFTDGYIDAVGVISGDFDPADNLICATSACPDLVEPDLVNQVLNLFAEERYSFIFRGSAQVLDHALTSTTLAAEVSGVEFGRGNADAAVDLINDPTTPLRSSDHDGLVVFALTDADADGVPNDLDVCPATAIPESVPTQGLNPNHWALIDGDGAFDTAGGSSSLFDLGDTAGCSCEQIIDAQGLGNGHRKFGCSTGVMRTWINSLGL